jgi:Cu(I)/Ag(I) efflux system membrane protein CusA/SilA
VRAAQRAVREQVELPPGYSISWAGEYEHMQRANARLLQIVPLTLLTILLLLYLSFRRIGEALLVMLTLPFAVIGGLWLMHWLGYNQSVATTVGLIALAGVAAEFGVVMLIYLDRSVAEWRAAGRLQGPDDLKAAIMEGAVLRVRPKAMTVAVIMAGLVPIMMGQGTGSEIMQRIAAPMVGGMITAPLLSMFVLPALYLWWQQRRFRQQAGNTWQ